MRGSDGRTGVLSSYVDLESRVRKDHPLRVIRAVVNEALGAMEREIASLYSGTGRPSIAPEKLLRAMLLQAFYSIRSERQLMERIEFDLLFRWFVGLGIDDPVWDHSTFSHAERVAALAMIELRADRPAAVTLGADRGYDAAAFVNELRTLNIRPHVAQNTTRRSAIDGRTTRHPGYEASQRVRKRIEEAFGWMKSVGGMRRPMLRGIPRVGFAFTFAAAAYNLVRLPKLLAEAPA